MRISCLFLLAWTSLAVISPRSLPAQTTSQKVRLFTNDNFTGVHGDFGIGKYSYNQLSSHGAYAVYSLKIPKGLRVTLFPQDNFKGKSLVLTEDTTQPTLLENGFANGSVSVSMVVDLAPDPVVVAPVAIATGPMVTIYQDNFSGASKSLSPGQYEFTELGIGNDQLSSLKIPKGMKVTLYENEAFEGKSLVLTKDTGAELIVSKGFNDMTSSLIVEMEPATPVTNPTTVTPVVVVVPVTTIPVKEEPVKEIISQPEYTGLMAIFYSDNFKGQSWKLKPGTYNYDEYFGLPANAPYSLRIPQGLIVTLFDGSAVMVENRLRSKGKQLALMGDTDSGYISSKGFTGNTFWVQVDEVPPVVVDPMVTIYKDDFSGASKTLTAGRYGYQDLGIGDNALSSISIPRGLKVTLYELPTFDGRTAVLMGDAGTEFFLDKQFNDLTSAMLVETVPSSELEIIIFKDDFSGASKSFMPGKYTMNDLGIGDNQLTSVKIPQGMKVTLYENDNFAGRSLPLTRNASAGFITSSKFNDITSSILVEDIFVPYVAPVVIEPVVTPVTPVIVAPVIVTPVTPEVVVPIVTVPPCDLKGAEFESAFNAIKAKAFRDEKMDMARITTKDKCLTVDQIRRITKLFSFSDQQIEFVKYAYDLSSEKSEYYKLDDVFVFMSDKEEFTKFLKSK